MSDLRSAVREKTTAFLLIVTPLIFGSACQPGLPSGAGNSPAASVPADAAQTAPPTGAKLSEAKPPTFSPNSGPDTGEAVKFPFDDFPKVETTAKPGDYVLAPSYNWIRDAAEKGVDSTSFIWYVQKMAAPDKEASEIQFSQERRKVPNPYVIAIPPKQRAKKGDIVLTWWQTGSGMNRAIVVDDRDAVSPTVRYLDIDYDNPAKSPDRTTTIGRMDEKIVPDSFFKIREWDAGTTVAVQDGANLKSAKVIRVAGDKVLVLEAAGRMKIYPKSGCKPVGVVPNVREGDRVKAPFVGVFKDATVVRVEAAIGRVFVKFDGQPNEKAVAFGDILK